MIASDFQNANARGARFTGADFRHLSLRGGDYEHAVFRGADLSDCQLTGANLIGADLSEADLSHSDIRGADMSQTLGLTQDQVNDACGDGGTRLPSGLKVHECHGFLRFGGWAANATHLQTMSLIPGTK